MGDAVRANKSARVREFRRYARKVKTGVQAWTGCGQGRILADPLDIVAPASFSSTICCGEGLASGHLGVLVNGQSARENRLSRGTGPSPLQHCNPNGYIRYNRGPILSRNASMPALESPLLS